MKHLPLYITFLIFTLEGVCNSPLSPSSILPSLGPIQILKFQETLKYYPTSSSYDTYNIASFSEGWTTSNEYAFSLWISPTVTSNWQDFYRVSTDTSQDNYEGRVLLLQIRSTADGFFQSGMTGDIYGEWNWKTGHTDSDFFPNGQWVFVVLATNYTANIQNGFRYTLSSTETTLEFQNRSADGSFYPLLQTGTVYVGGSPFTTSTSTSCYLQYARLYIDYFPNSQDEMINLAIMDSGNLYILYFASYPTINSNSTIPGLVVENNTNTTTTANKGDESTPMPQLGPYNILNCRNMSIISLSTGSSSIDGMVIAMNIRPLGPVTTAQTIFSVRDSSNNFVSISFTIQSPSITSLAANYGAGWSAGLSGPTLTLNAWNRLVVELVQAQPTEFGTGFSTFRAWVNGTGISRVPAGDSFSSKIIFPNMTDATLDLCSQKTFGTTVSTEGFNGDILNLLWYRGSESLFVNSTEPSCALTGFLYPNQRACLQCNTGYYFYDMTCVSSCPSDTYTHEDTRSCIKCQEAGQYFDSNGFCVACNNPGQVPIQAICQSCDSTCATCSGTTTNCLSCPSNRYLVTDGNCLSCDSSCQTCDGSNVMNCLSCYQGYFLYPNTRGQCLNLCPAGYWGNKTTNTCQPCYSNGSGPYYTCTTCSAGGSSNCDSCNPLTFLYNSQCINPCPAGYWGNTTTNTCQHCYSSSIGPYYSCATCSSGGTNNNCSSCNSGYFLYPNTGGQCLNICPAGYWGSTTTNTCQQCYSNSTGPCYSCATCSRGGANNNCDSCNPGSFLYSSQCLSTCPDGYWPNNTTNACQLCLSDTVNISSCPNKVKSTIVSALQISAKSSSTVLVASLAALQNSNSASSTLTVNLFLYLAAIEAIANMQYLNLDHSQIALDAYSGLSASIIPNRITNYNTINSSLLVFNYGIFEKNQISPLYLDNYGDSLTENLIYFGVYLILLPITFIKTTEKLLNSRLGKAYAIALGLFLSNVFGQIQGQILFSVLQILKIDLLVDAYSRSSYSIAWITMYAIIWLQLFCFCKLKAIFSFKQRQKKMIEVNSKDTHNQNELTANTINFRWTEKQYDMMFSSYKDDNKLRFFFTYWMILFDSIYIALIICLQYVPGLQCLSIVLLTIYFIVFSAILRPMKEKSTAIIFFFNYASVLLVATLNLVLAAREVSNSKPTNNDDIGLAIYIIITINSSMNILFTICDMLSRMHSLYRKWKDRRQKSNTESNKDLTIGKSANSQKANRFINVSNAAVNFIEEQEEETPKPQIKLHIEELKTLKKKKKHSLRRNKKRIHIPELD